MPYLLRFDGADDHVVFPEVLLGASTFDVEFDFVARSIASGTYQVVYSNDEGTTNARHAMYMWSSSRAEIAYIIGGVRRLVNTPAGTFVAGNRYKVNAIYNGSSLNVLVNGVSAGSVAASGTVGGTRGLTSLGRPVGAEGRSPMDLYGFKITANGVLVRNYDPSDTSSGATLIDKQSGQNGALTNFTVPACWVFYSSGGATYSGGAATSYAIDTAGGGLALRLGGAVTTYTIDTLGGGTRTTSSGAATSYALDSIGGGARTTSAGAVTTYAIGTVGGGDVIKGATAYTGGAAVTFAADATGGGVVIRGGGALLNFTAETTGGGTRTTSSGGAVTVSLITVGGGDVIGPGYKPTITAPAVAVRRTYTGRGVRVVKTYRAPYTVAIQKTYRGPTCRL